MTKMGERIGQVEDSGAILKQDGASARRTVGR